LPIFAVGVVQRRDPGGAVRVVLDMCDLCGDTVLVVAPEVDHPVGALVAAADVACGDPAGAVAPAALAERADQRLLRRGQGDLDEVGDRGAAASRSRSLVPTDSIYIRSS